ncbi:MAG: HIT family protein [Anaerolineaceae bacterium]|nr:HIT family protein [Anaerolineaceae bacterium]
MMDRCVFCRIVEGSAPSWKVYEDERTLAFLDIHPVNKYHTLVIPKQHYENIFDLPEDELLAVMKVVKLLARKYREKLGINNLQIIHSCGREAQQDVFHAHFHIVPRHFDDGNNVRWETHPEWQSDFDELLRVLNE